VGYLDFDPEGVRQQLKPPLAHQRREAAGE